MRDLQSHPMFSLKFIKRTLTEYKQSLLQEFQSLQKKLTANQINIFEKYLNENSLAGMNVWLNNYHERSYFQDVLEELNKEEDIFSFYENIGKLFIQDFGEEDFRFLEWERANPDKNTLQKILRRWVKEAEKKLTKYDKTYSTRGNSLLYYYKAKENPAEVGANVRLISSKTPKEKVEQVEFAEKELEKLFPYGYDLYKLLTQKIIIIQSEGLVSYSFFHEPGISYINVMDRNLLQTIDDLVHENAHHHLNLILKKYKILKPDHTKKVFYSPWRKELRGIYAILHAVFTFSFGAQLFSTIIDANDKVPTQLTEEDFEIACLRFVEESLMLEYSLFDLNQNLDSFTQKGKELIQTLSNWNSSNLNSLDEVESKTKRKTFLKKIKDLKKSLDFARQEFQVPYEV
ncbi:MAG: HEXXH motif-containing putative peptide modification protein [Leptospiraceae bacterium]|nr:HEXXH motif-containing putative peptide modification protein [Leptospiraceae bacterium]